MFSLLIFCDGFRFFIEEGAFPPLLLHLPQGLAASEICWCFSYSSKVSGSWKVLG